MSLDTKFDELFALRVSFQDEYENESDIIRKLNYELIQRGIPIENISNYLKEFYEYFGINISIEEIKIILEQPTEEQITNQFINVINQFVNSHIANNNINENNHDDNDDDDDDDDYDDDDDEDIIENNSEENLQNNTNNIIANSNNIIDNTNNIVVNSNNIIDTSNNIIDTSNNIIDTSNNIVANTNNIIDTTNNIVANTNNQIIGNTYLHSNMQFQFSHIVSGGTIHYNINEIFPLHGNIINPNSSIMLPLFSHLFSELLLPDQISEDVISTLDDSEKDKLSIYKLIEKKEEKCSICMSDLNIDEQVCDLPCKHTFHDECIQPWLSNYNYKCPICRKEVGKPKHNI